MRGPETVMMTFSILLGCSCGYPPPIAVTSTQEVSFRIAVPGNWILEENAGETAGRGWILVPGGFTARNSPVVMYARAGGSSYHDARKYIAQDIAEFLKYGTRELPATYNPLAPRRMGDTLSAAVYDYCGGVQGTFERIAYIQGPGAVCCVVLSARSAESFHAYADALFEALDGFRFRRLP